MIGVLRRRVMGGGGAAPLPYDAEIEYITNTGSQYINTGIILESTTTEVKCVFEASFSVFNVSGNSLMLAASMPNAGLQLYTHSSRDLHNQGAALNLTANVTSELTTITTATRRSIQADGGTVINQNFSRSISDGSTVYIIGEPGFSGNNRSARASVMSWKLYINSVLVRDFIPVRVGTTGYMYDRVSGQLFGNSGTGDFVLGADV